MQPTPTPTPPSSCCFSLCLHLGALRFVAYQVLGPGILGLSEFQKLVCWGFGGRVGRVLGYEGGWDLPAQGEILAPPWLWTSRLVKGLWTLPGGTLGIWDCLSPSSHPA